MICTKLSNIMKVRLHCLYYFGACLQKRNKDINSQDFKLTRRPTKIVYT